ncbi:MAG TPA: hypothetical protein DCY42_00860 [Chloroflexi bacterium]|nr:hypothetical protein [Chloroflexota bacterium]
MADLSGRRVVVTRPQKQCQQFTDILASKGAIPFCFPVIEISPMEDNHELDEALQNLSRYHWFVLTSVNGVAAVWDRLAALGIQDLPEHLKLACIGPKTATALAEKGFRADFVPDEFIAEAILPGLGELNGLKVLLARADLARPDLPQAIQAGGGIAHDISAYRTLPSQPDSQVLAEIAKGTHILTFTSPSTVENFFQIMLEQGLDPLHLPGNPITACIGPITANAARAKGYQVEVVPEDYTTEGLLQALIQYYAEHKI